MNKVKETGTVSYEDERIEGTEIDAAFTKTVSQGSTTVFGRLKKNGSEVGNVTWDAKNGHLLTNIKPLNDVSMEEITAVYKAIPVCLTEILAD